jgi:hypothetical protein
LIFVIKYIAELFIIQFLLFFTNDSLCWFIISYPFFKKLKSIRISCL